jgi:hypothetical protein
MPGRAALVAGSILRSNIVLEERRETRRAGDGRLMYHPQMGFVGRPGHTADGVSHDAQGRRNVPASPGAAPAGPPVLAVGDSYAYGDEVGDRETWPALVQARLGRRVVNAGVSGYGLDQTVLQAERLAGEAKPAALVLVFIADNLRRAEMKRVWGAEKPYFVPAEGGLSLHNVPVPRSPDPAATLDLWQRLFGWSVLVDTVLRHKGWQYEWSIDHLRISPRGTGEAMACPLMQRVARLGVPTLVVAEYDPWVWKNADYRREQRRLSAHVLDCARRAGLATLDLFEAIDAAVTQKGYDAIFRTSHPGPAGHAIAADRVADALSRSYIPPR